MSSLFLLCLPLLSLMHARYRSIIEVLALHEIKNKYATFYAEENLTLFRKTRSRKVHLESPSACGDYCSPMAATNGTWRSEHAKSFTGKSNVAGSVGSEWCPEGCLLAEFYGVSPSAISNRALLQGTKLVIVGNSHMRNLYRCLGERLSGGESARDRTACPGTACLSCHSFMAVHGVDLSFSISNVSMEFYWTVLWDIPTNIRMRCNLTQSVANSSGILEADSVRRCVARAARKPVSYIGSRIGLDFLRTEVASASLIESDVRDEGSPLSRNR